MQSKVRCAAPAKKISSCEENAFLWTFAKEIAPNAMKPRSNAQIKEAWQHASILMRSWHGDDSCQVTGGFAAALFWRMRSCNGIGGNVLQLPSNHGSYVKPKRGREIRGAQRNTRERVKCAVLLHCIRICSFASYSSHSYEHLISSPL
jgi:hypothetical protein